MGLSPEVEARVEALIVRFPDWLDVFDRELPFSRAGQRDGHVATLTRWEQLGGDVPTLLSDDAFITSLHATLRAWGIGRRGSRLQPLDRFREALLVAEPELVSLQEARVWDPEVSEPGFIAKLWELVAGLGVVENATPMIAGTKTLHHVLPRLVVPIDRMYTGAFFGWSTGQMQNRQRDLFTQAWAVFSRVAEVSDLPALTGSDWRMSEAKLIDNAVVGYCKEEGLVTNERNVNPEAGRSVRKPGGKYGPLRDALRDRTGTVEMSFAEIDAIVGGLPASARNYRAWWANHAGNPQAQSWIASGKTVEHVDLARARVRFRSRPG